MIEKKMKREDIINKTMIAPAEGFNHRAEGVPSKLSKILDGKLYFVSDKSNKIKNNTFCFELV